LVWVVVMTVHVLGHVSESVRVTWSELRDAHVPAAARGRPLQTAAIAQSLVAGIGLASALLPSASGWTSSRSGDFGRHHDR
jgi:hypothetical protein